jgi:hypothetical protein
MERAWPALAAFAALLIATIWSATASPASLSDGMTADAQRADRLQVHLDALAQALDPQAAATLARMPDRGRQLLAARAYLRAGAQIGERWSWSAQRAQEFEQSPEKRALDAAIARVNCAFSAANPGHDLFVNPQFRSLDIQLQRWNENASVGQAARGMLAAASLAAADWPDAQSAAGRRRFAQWLRGWQPVPVPTLAAPGLSPHGQARAVDFQVRHAGRIVAGPVAASIGRDWKAAGWGQRLAEATAVAGGFTGPLRIPDEPRHYTFTPDQPAARGGAGDACQH